MQKATPHGTLPRSLHLPLMAMQPLAITVSLKETRATQMAMLASAASTRSLKPGTPLTLAEHSQARTAARSWRIGLLGQVLTKPKPTERLLLGPTLVTVASTKAPTNALRSTQEKLMGNRHRLPSLSASLSLLQPSRRSSKCQLQMAVLLLLSLPRSTRISEVRTISLIFALLVKLWPRRHFGIATIERAAYMQYTAIIHFGNTLIKDVDPFFYDLSFMTLSFMSIYVRYY